MTDTLIDETSAPSAAPTCLPEVGRIGDVPVYIPNQPAGVRFEVASDGAGIVLTPSEPLPLRCTIRPAAIFQNERGYFDATTVMGRLVFSKSAYESQSYEPFTHDPQRKLRALFLCIETMPEDDWSASAQRFANMTKVTAALMAAADIPFNPPTRADVETLLTFTQCEQPLELVALYGLARWACGRGECIIEIGSFRGRFLTTLCLALEAVGSGSALLSVDPHVDQPLNREHVRLALRQIGQEHRLVQIAMSSDDAAGLLRPRSASMVLIDGDHSHDQVVRDITNYGELLAPGGLMLLHDYGFGAHTGSDDYEPGVRSGVDEVLLDHADYRPLLLAHTLMVFEKKTIPS